MDAETKVGFAQSTVRSVIGSAYTEKMVGFAPRIVISTCGRCVHRYSAGTGKTDNGKLISDELHMPLIEGKGRTLHEPSDLKGVERFSTTLQ